ncbi:zinc-ribbon domain-containing protein (plasmid) [Halorientalis pallida]
MGLLRILYRTVGRNTSTLWECRNCGQSLSEEAKECPNCGAEDIACYKF